MLSGSLIWFRFAWFGWVVLAGWGFCFPSGWYNIAFWFAGCLADCGGLLRFVLDYCGFVGVFACWAFGVWGLVFGFIIARDALDVGGWVYYLGFVSWGVSLVWVLGLI